MPIKSNMTSVSTRLEISITENYVEMDAKVGAVNEEYLSER